MATEADDTAREEIRAYERCKNLRSNFDSMFHEIAKYVLPRADDFITKHAPGARRDQFVFDSTAQLALPRFAAAMESLLVPSNQKWHGLKPADVDLEDNQEIAVYLEAKRDLMFRVRYGRRSAFAGQVGECFMSLGAFGTMAMFIEDGLSRGPLYQSIPLSQLFIEEDAQGQVDTVRRRYTLNCRQAIQKFGSANLPEEITKHEVTDPGRDFEFLHVCRPNTDRKAGDRSYRGMKIAAFDICVSTKSTLRRGGYRVMPYAVSRYTTAPGEVYGRSVAWDAFADIKTLNAQSKTGLRYGELVTDPPWITADVDSLSPFAMRPGAINPGYMNERGQVLAQSLAPQGDPRVGLEMMDQRRLSINTSFLVTLFQILIETPRMTATEALLRAQEKGALLAPTSGRQRAEFLDPLIARELDIFENAGVFDDMPDELRNAGGISEEIAYDSPMTRLQMAEEGVGIQRTLETAAQIAQYDEGKSLRAIDMDWTLRRMAKINGAPARMMRSEETLAAEDAAAAEEAQLQRLLQAAPVVADTAKTAVETGRMATQAPF